MSATLTIRGVRSVAVEVPMAIPLGTSAQKIDCATLLLIDLDTHEGVTGRAYVFCVLKAAAAPVAHMLQEALRVVKGDKVAPHEIRMKLLRHFRLIGVQGIIRMAMAGLDVACWDAWAIAAGLPLVRMLGGVPKPVPAYNSKGLGLKAPDPLADEAEKLLEGGFRAIKLRLGYQSLEADLAAVRAVRRRIPGDILLMVDFNQALSVAEAIRRGRALDGEGIYWIEEPIRHDDYPGNAEVAAALATPVQIGENFSGPQAMVAALGAKACDYVMPDLERIGGVSGWQQAGGSPQRRASRCPRTSIRKFLHTFSPSRRPPTGSNTSTGPTRFCAIRFVSSMAPRSFRTGPDRVSSGTRTRSRVTGSSNDDADQSWGQAAPVSIQA